jgi:hypothetical protein
VLPHRQDVDHRQLLTGKQRGMVEYLPQNFALAWKLSARALVGENHAFVHGNLVDAVMAFDQFGFQAELLGDGGRQPGGPVIKASFNTIRDPNARFPILSFCHDLFLSVFVS